MKNLFALTLTFLFTLSLVKVSHAQSAENRTKIQMTVSYDGKNIITDLDGVSTSLSRNYEETPAITAAKDSAKNKNSGYNPGSFYMSLSAKNISDELLEVFAKKQNRFDGTITIVDTYGKNPTRTIKFKQAGLYSYSDQISTGSYSEAYGTSAIAIICREVSVNGITIEQ